MDAPTPSSNKSESEKAKEKIGDFQYKESKSYELLVSSFGQELIQNELLQLAELFSSERTLPRTPGRSEKRNKQLLYKFFDEENIFPIFKDFVSHLAIATSIGEVKGPKSEAYKAYMEAHKQT